MRLSRVSKMFFIVWASPTSVIALAVALLGVPFGTKFQMRQGAIEAHGGLISKLLAATPVSAAAMTLGHVIWGRCPASLDLCRDHEHVHVRQYERWGPLFVPMYLTFSATMWLRGKHPYYDNPFEKEAYGPDHPHYRRTDKPESNDC